EDANGHAHLAGRFPDSVERGGSLQVSTQGTDAPLLRQRANALIEALVVQPDLVVALGCNAPRKTKSLGLVKARLAVRLEYKAQFLRFTVIAVDNFESLLGVTAFPELHELFRRGGFFDKSNVNLVCGIHDAREIHEPDPLRVCPCCQDQVLRGSNSNV